MNEDSLKTIHVNEVFDMLDERMKAIMNLDENEDNIEFEIIRKEIELLQRVIFARRLEFPPG